MLRSSYPSQLASRKFSDDATMAAKGDGEERKEKELNYGGSQEKAINERRRRRELKLPPYEIEKDSPSGVN